jgi:hypothetical protein
MSSNVDGNDTWTAPKLVVVGIITLAIAFGVISMIAETGLNKF